MTDSKKQTSLANGATAGSTDHCIEQFIAARRIETDPEETGPLYWAGRQGKQGIRGYCVERGITVEWNSNERAPVSGDAYEWFGRSWPVFFDEPNVYLASRNLLTIEGRVGAGGFAEHVRAYEQWATTHGLSRYADEEPDMRGDLQMADDAFIVTIQDRAQLATISVRPRDDP